MGYGTLSNRTRNVSLESQKDRERDKRRDQEIGRKLSKSEERNGHTDLRNFKNIHLG